MKCTKECPECKSTFETTTSFTKHKCVQDSLARIQRERIEKMIRERSALC